MMKNSTHAALVSIVRLFSVTYAYYEVYAMKLCHLAGSWAGATICFVFVLLRLTLLCDFVFLLASGKEVFFSATGQV